MTELTDNQKKVVESIKDGHAAIDEITVNSGLSKPQVTGVITSLSKKGLIDKNTDGTYSLVQSESSEEQSSKGSDLETVLPGQKNLKVLIPYLRSEAAGEELKYALRSLQENLKLPFQVVIIGDREDWFSPNIIHIPHEVHLIKEDCNCPAPSMVRNPQADVTHKIFTAIASGEIEGDFILSNDDIFLLGPTYLSEIEVLKAFGTLDKGGKEGGIYNQNIKRTAKVLEANKLPTHRYGAHIPVLLNADHLLEIIEKYNALDKGFLLTSLYFNEKFPEARPIQVTGTANDSILASAYRADIPKDLLLQVFQTRKFLNCDSKGWQAVRPFLEQAFPNPSDYEK